MIEKYWWIMDYYNNLHMYTFGYCLDANCKHSDEHEYRYDGQVFYKIAQTIPTNRERLDTK